MRAIKTILNGKEFILPEENDGMLEVRGLTYERIEVEYIQHMMEDIVDELNNQ
jgi:hypothetical protein